ncbi:indole-3-acetaldehyde oxidase-like [Haliotis rufescens]|uniref:indole-3-acetaldehyde oxidase-like n=1 Tax=Haliotis rufescens TaxID=6454 RepID=UPI00201EC2A5|nr:indole-3-acetaldehyde oxidase-like [Haliotis rufescens]XP_048248148.1 indole-3-acetaldehyde oxidase-like [Haliotis rufescens]
MPVKGRNQGQGNVACTPARFFINGKQHTVHGEYDPTTSLNDYIRDTAGLRGTKVMCREGGCGCCAVMVTQKDVASGQDSSFSINSCLCPLYSVDGWQITTVEGIGNRKDGYHPIQDRIAKFNGSQCGYCTPGMVMNMYGLLHDNPTPTQQNVEDKFDGNICRCTGYRPILDAMKSFAVDSSIPQSQCIDIEDLNKKLCPRTGMECGADGLRLCLGEQSWYRPETLKAMAGIVMENQGKKVRLLYGNTASGVYKDDGPFSVYIDLHHIKDLYQIQVTDTSMQFGANMSLSKLIDTLDLKKSEKGYAYFGAIASHLRKIGNVLLRNAGSWAGNVMIKHAHPDFPSDVFTVMEAAGAHIAVVDCADGVVKSYPLLSLITEIDMKIKLIVSLELFKQDEKFKLISYKIMPRSQNAHAYVNAGFQIHVDAWKFKVVKKPSLVFGGINRDLIHAYKTEALLNGKTLTDGVVLRSALDCLASELEPTADRVLASAQYRRSLAVNLLYKCILELCGAKHQTRVSGPFSIERPLSSGVREFQEKKADWPLKEPMPKLASHAQASGEAEFVNDIPSSTQELCGAFVVTSQGPATIQNVDASCALRLPGVVDYISVKDITGVNNHVASLSIAPLAPEELFCSGKVLFAGQPVGLILAESQTAADEAAKKVAITYSDTRPPILTLDEAIEKESFFANPMAEHRLGDPETAMKKCSKTLSGRTLSGSNYHFYMENQVTLCVPSEERLDVYTATQSSELTQGSVSMVTGLPMNNVVVTVPRVGGSFGGKAFCSIPVAAAAAVAAHKTKKPVKISVNMSTNMKMSGKRFQVLAKYDVGFDEAGRVHVVSMDVYCDGGSSPNAALFFSEVMMSLDQGYYIPNWRIKLVACRTDKAGTTIMRAPGTLPAGLLIESVFEHVAKHLSRNVLEIKELNLYKAGQTDLRGHELTYCTLRKLWTDLQQWADVARRKNEVNSFNKANQWKKRGLTMTPVKYGMLYMGSGFTVDVAIYARDGTVTVVQGGVEMGQGLFTKVAQAVAMTLGIPVSKVKVLPNQSHTTANSFLSGGSTASEISVMSALKCCEILKERMAPVRETNPDSDWEALVKACDLAGIELTAKHKSVPKKKDGPGEFHYFTYCVGVTEVELDVLTGENQVRRVDILFDCGESLNPTIDIGQIEGAYVMGLGNLLTENIIYDPETGAVLTDGTWEYKPPTTKDIPVDIRIRLLPDAPNPYGVKASKASGEPPIVLATGALYALKQAMEEARFDLTSNKEFQPTVAPYTVERLMLGCGVHVDKLVL